MPANIDESKEFSSLKDDANEMTRNCKSNPPYDDLRLQLCKIAAGLHSDRYLKEADCIRKATEKPANMQEEEFRKRLEQEEIFVSPMAFKALAGKGHPDFVTSLQQDASEYLAHLFALFEKDAKSNGTKDLSEVIYFRV